MSGPIARRPALTRPVVDPDRRVHPEWQRWFDAVDIQLKRTQNFGNYVNSMALDAIGDVLSPVIDISYIDNIPAVRFAETISPVQVVDTLPADNTGGDVVLLTTDAKLYRWNGTGWTVAVPTVDLTGQITGTQIGNNSVTTPKVVALNVTTNLLNTNAVTAAKMDVDSVTAGAVKAGAINASAIIVDNIIVKEHLVVGAATGHADAEAAGPISQTAGTINTYTDLLSLTVATDGRPVEIQAIAVMRNTDPGSHNIWIRIVRDDVGAIWPASTEAKIPIVNTTDAIYNALWVETPAAGTYTYRWQFKTDSTSIQAWNPVLTLDEIIR